jgi:hypothetical protein
LDAAAFSLILATLILASFMAVLRPAMAAADQYGCRGDQACIKIAETTKCYADCQRQCKELRFDAAGCYTTWGPKFEFWRQQAAEKRGAK